MDLRAALEGLDLLLVLKLQEGQQWGRGRERDSPRASREEGGPPEFAR